MQDHVHIQQFISPPFLLSLPPSQRGQPGDVTGSGSWSAAMATSIYRVVTVRLGVRTKWSWWVGSALWWDWGGHHQLSTNNVVLTSTVLCTHLIHPKCCISAMHECSGKCTVGRKRLYNILHFYVYMSDYIYNYVPQTW